MFPNVSVTNQNDSPTLFATRGVIKSGSPSSTQMVNSVWPLAEIMPPTTSHTGSPQLVSFVIVMEFEKSKHPLMLVMFSPMPKFKTGS